VVAPSTGKKEAGRHLDVSALESWLWEAACVIRGPLDAPKFKDYILPLVFLKRLSDVLEDEIGHLAQDFGDQKTAAKLVDQDHKLVRFFIPPTARWPAIAEKTTGLGEHLTDAVRALARENPRLSGVIDVTDFNATAAGQRIVDDGRLAALVQVLNNPDYRLGLDDVEPDILGRAYEYLLRKFAEGQGQSAGEFYTPRAVAVVMALLRAVAQSTKEGGRADRAAAQAALRDLAEEMFGHRPGLAKTLSQAAAGQHREVPGGELSLARGDARSTPAAEVDVRAVGDLARRSAKLSRGQKKILAFVARYDPGAGGAPLRLLRPTIRAGAAAFSKSVGRLLARGLLYVVTRDGRGVTHVSLTRDGKAILFAVTPKVTANK
jgi:hypothetical protein